MIGDSEYEEGFRVGREEASDEITRLRQQVATLIEQRDMAVGALAKFRDNVLFRIGSASPYRQVADEYFQFIKPIIQSSGADNG